MNKLKNLEVASFCEQMSMIIKSGITPKDGLSILLSDSKDENFKEVLHTLIDTISKGEPFTNAVKQSEAFPGYVENMIAIGEETGTLDDVMQALAEYYEHEETVAENIKSALTYPFVMIVMMLLIIGIILAKVMPLFNQVFIQLGMELSGLPASLLHAGNVIHSYSFLFLLFLILLTAGYFFLTHTVSGAKSFTRFFSHFGPTKNFYTNVSYGRFASGMALMLGSGMGFYESLEMTKTLVGSPALEEKIERCRKDILEGDNFSEALVKEQIFSNLYSRMVSIAVKTGNTDTVLRKIAMNYDEETDKKLNRFISVLEPTLVISLSLIVGLILLSVILPLLGIMTSIG